MGSHVGLAGTAAGPLARHDDALDEELTAPDTPRLPALEGAGQACGADGAVGAQGLRVLDVLGSSAKKSSGSKDRHGSSEPIGSSMASTNIGFTSRLTSWVGGGKEKGRGSLVGVPRPGGCRSSGC